MESIDNSSSGAIVTFKTRQDAEIAVAQIGTIKFKDHLTLKCSWFDEASKNKMQATQKKYASLKSSSELKAGDDQDDDKKNMDDDSTLGIPLHLDDDLLLDDDLEEEEETDDDNESRSWRR